jgi:hypothetical protein
MGGGGGEKRVLKTKASVADFENDLFHQCESNKKYTQHKIDMHTKFARKVALFSQRIVRYRYLVNQTYLSKIFIDLNYTYCNIQYC